MDRHRGGLATVVKESVVGYGCLACRDVDNGAVAVGILQLLLGIVKTASGQILHVIRRLETVLENTRLVYHQNGSLLERLGSHIDRDGVDGGQQDGHHDGENPKRGFLDASHVLALYDKEYLSHGLFHIFNKNVVH